MQGHGSRLSSSMNQNSFFSWIFFDPLISGYFLFLLIPCLLGNVETAAAKWDPHVILYVQSTFFSWSFFWHLKFGHLPFFFRSPAASQTVIPLLLTGTRMSSSMYYKTFFS